MDPLFTTGRQIDDTEDLVDALCRQSNERRFTVIEAPYVKSTIQPNEKIVFMSTPNVGKTTSLFHRFQLELLRQYITRDEYEASESHLPHKTLIAMHVNVICRNWGKR